MSKGTTRTMHVLVYHFL